MANVPPPSEDPEQLLLSDWYANPIPCDEAEQLLSETHRAEQQALIDSQPLFSIRLKRLLACYWCGKNIEHDFRSLVATYHGQYEQALLQLVYGQLLISQKRSGALRYLQKGFELAVPFLTYSQYFQVMKRHQALANLVLGVQPQVALPLDDLVQEGEVIARLKGQKYPTKNIDHKDTLG